MVLVLCPVGSDVLNFSILPYQRKVDLDHTIAVFVDFEHILGNGGVPARLIEVALDHLQKTGLFILVMDCGHNSSGSRLKSLVDEGRGCIEK